MEKQCKQQPKRSHTRCTTVGAKNLSPTQRLTQMGTPQGERFFAPTSPSPRRACHTQAQAEKGMTKMIAASACYITIYCMKLPEILTQQVQPAIKKIISQPALQFRNAVRTLGC
jgi:hypothetical protein